MSTIIRAARRSELPAVYRVLESAFTGAPIQLFIDQTEGDSTLRMRYVRVAEVDGGIAAHVRIFARRMLIRGVPVRAGGVGSVASAPGARGLGLPSALLHDAIDAMVRERTAVSFLYTGIPAFYERLGWRIIREPVLDADAMEAAQIPRERGYRIRRIEDEDVPALLSIYRRATAGTTGAIARTATTWRDAQRWLGEDRAGCVLAESGGPPVAYLRARSRDHAYTLLEAEYARGYEAAVASLVSLAARRAVRLRQQLATYAPADSVLAEALRALPSTRETTDVRYPAMMRIISLDAFVAGLLPQFDDCARTHRGAPFTLGMRAPDGQSLTLDVRAASARTRRAAAAYQLDEAGTLDGLLGQRRASDLARPRPPLEIRRRIDALLPETPFHFWNSDRI
jgi:predicted N-acetyltransferase YhbS